MSELTNKLTMYQVAEMLNTSHTTIYSKINNEEIKKELESFIIYHGKSRYLKPDGVDILRKYMKDSFDKPLESGIKILEDINKPLESKDDLNNENSNKSVNGIDNKTLELFINTLESKHKDLESKDKEYIYNLKAQIEDLNKKLDSKEKQVETMTLRLSEALEASNKLVENNQILLGQLQNNVMLIESTQEKKSWLKRWFS